MTHPPASAAGRRPAAAPAQALRLAAAAWLAVAIAGQLVFAAGVAVFYTRAVLRDDPLAWNRFMTHGYMPGQTADNAAGVAHVLVAVVVILAGALQLVPRVRRAAPLFHRWSGRVYVAAALTLSLAGLWLVWVRGTPGSTLDHAGLTLNAVLIILCAAASLTHARARNLAAHRRWALRLFLVVNGMWFFRVAVFLSFIVFHGPFGFNPRTFEGPFLTIVTFGAYLLPLAVLELYLRTQDRPTPGRQWAMASGLAALTLAMAAGAGGVAFGLSVPAIAAATARQPLDEALSVTIAAAGVDAAVTRYRTIAAPDAPATEDQLNALGYELIHSNRLADAIRILRLNAADHPRSANAYDSLAEAYLDAADIPLAIANYQESLQLNPRNTNAAEALDELLAAPSGQPR